MAVLYKEQVGEAIRERRKELGLTQPQLADRIEAWLRENRGRAEGQPFSAQNVSRWERGANMAEGDNLEAVAASLETDVATLLSGIKPRTARRERNGTEMEQLDRIERMLRALAARLGVDPADLEVEELVELVPGATAAPARRSPPPDAATN